MTSLARLERLEDRAEALLARRAARTNLRQYERYAADPVGFGRDILRSEYWSRQVEIMESVRDHRFVCVRSCNAAGKDFSAGDIGHWWVCAKGGYVIISGPTERQVTEILMRREVSRGWNRAKLPGEVYMHSLRIPGDPNRGILALTSSESSKLTGFHAPRVLVIITEGQAVERWAYEGLFACATGAEDRVLVLGNPLVPEGKFFDISRSAHWKNIRISALEHPNVIEGRTVIPGGVTREFVDTIAREYGVGSGQYRARVEGEFPDESDETLVRRSWLEAAAQRWHKWASSEDDVSSLPLAFALDVARYGADHSVLAVRQGHVLREFVTWAQADIMESVGRVGVALEKFGVNEASYEPTVTNVSGFGRIVTNRGPKILVDEVGIGSGALDRLRERGFHVTGFNGGRAPTAGTPERQFANRRAESYWHLRRLLEEGCIALPRDEKLFDELAATKWKVNSTGKIQIEPKDDLRARIGRSPDRADAVAMAFADFTPKRPTQREPVRW